MTKTEQKIANLQKLISDIEEKMERLETQKKLYQLQLNKLKKNQKLK